MWDRTVLPHVLTCMSAVHWNWMPRRAIWAGCEKMKDCRSISYTLRAARFTIAFTVPCIPSTSLCSHTSTMPAPRSTASLCGPAASDRFPRYREEHVRYVS